MNKRPVSVKEELKTAMTELLKEKPFSEVSVTDLVKEAGVARASFYRNFSSTSDVLDEIIDDVLLEFSHKVLPVMYSSDEKVWRGFLFEYIDMVRENRRVFINILTLNAADVFSRLNDRIQAYEKALPYDGIREKYMVASRLGILSNVLRHWIDTGMEESPEELVEYLMSFIMKI